MQNRGIEFWVGVFTLAGIGLALFMVYTTGDLGWSGDSGYDVYVDFRNIAGLDEGDTVRVAGVESGKVAAINLKYDVARVCLRIKPDVALYQDATAEVKSMGILGSQYVSVEPGHQRLPRVPEGGTIQSAVAQDNINVVMGKLSTVASDIQAVTENMKKVFGGDTGREAMQEILANTRDLSGQLLEITQENREQFHQITTHLAALTGEIQIMVAENSAAINETVATLPQTADNLRSITAETRQLMQAHREDLSNMMTQLSLASKRLDASMQNMEYISQQMRDGEGTLGMLINDPSLYDEARNTMLEARNLIEDLREQAPISAFISMGGVVF